MSVGKAPRIALLFSQFSAYHVDRCEAVAERLAGRFEVLAVEVATRSETYAWGPSGDLRHASKVTLFSGRSYETIPWYRRLFAQLRALRGCRAVFVGIGYNEPDIIVLSWLLRLRGTAVYAMSESKFDDYQRSVGFELVKSALLAAYSGAIVGGRRQESYFRFLGFRRRPILPGYDSVGLDRVRAMGGGRLAPGGLPFKQRGFIFVGRFVDKKNLLALIDGYAIYARAAGVRHRTLTLVGSGPEDTALRARIALHGLESKIALPGFLDAGAVAQLMAASLALVLPSRIEQWGLVVNEALAFGLPAIVTAEVGARDALIRSGVNGFVVESDSPEGLGAAMAMLGKDERSWTQMVAASHARAWLGDTARLADAVEALLDPGAADARKRIERFATELPPEQGAPGAMLPPLPRIDAGPPLADPAAARAAYWDSYYSGRATPGASSDFARFSAPLFARCNTVIDVGCGNGRDSIHFLGLGKQVCGVDGSKSAIAAAKARARDAGYPDERFRFMVGDVGSDDVWNHAVAGSEGPLGIYARFLFHAIDDATECRLLDQVCAQIIARDGVLSAEFRTPEDAALSKVMPAHYRRFVDPEKFCARLTERGLAVVYRRIGQGMAVYEGEDAYVARIVATPAITYAAGVASPGLRRLQDAERDLARRFFAWCQTHQLEPFLACGSALGAMRHGDFVPWDDDIDLGMLREDFERLHAAWQSDPMSSCYLQSHRSEPGYLYPFAKLRLDDTHIEVPSHEGQCRHDGIAIDIFPFDRLPASRGVQRIQAGLLGAINLLLFPPSPSRLAATRSLWRRSTMRLSGLLRQIIPLPLLLAVREYVSRMPLARKCEISDSFGMYGVRFGPHTAIQTRTLVPTSRLPFGPISAPVPGQCDDYLTALFGEWRTLPPEQARRPGHVLAAASFAVPRRDSSA